MKTVMYERNVGKKQTQAAIEGNLTDYLLINSISSMARPKSEDKRKAIMAATTRLIVTQGLSAPTAMIAHEAGVSNGSLFTYFETKADIFNKLYLELKAEMAAAIFEGHSAKSDLRDQVVHLWSNWTAWSASHPEKRRALAQLNISDEITPESRAAAHKAMAYVGELLERTRAKGPMRQSPMPFVTALMVSVADTTADFMIHDPANADHYSKIGFDALWRMIA